MKIEPRFMRRAIDLARHGLGGTGSNPMVGAVIVHDDIIIGEGYHRRYGEAHAEVNAVAAVSDRNLLADSTIYVTLEPCSHYGKTPPCAKLLAECGIRRVVVGSLDPFEKVSGRGVAMLRNAGAEVVTGILEAECEAINPVFMTAHRLHRPWVTLKWAQSADGFIDGVRSMGQGASLISTPLTSTLMHRQRTLHGAIMVGSGTMLADNPRLTSRFWPGSDPLKVVADRRGRVPSGAQAIAHGALVLTGRSVYDDLCELYSRHGITSVLVEGGRELLQAFIDDGLWDAARIETATRLRLGAGVEAPHISGIALKALTIGDNRIDYYAPYCRCSR